MFRKLLPQEHSYFDMFEQHSLLGLEACRTMKQMLSMDGELAAHSQHIKEIEKKADHVTHECMDALHRTFITPMDRSDIHKLIQRLDDLVDSVESASSRLVLYEITERRPDALKLGDILVQSAEEIVRAMPMLRDLKHADAIKASCVKLFDLENQGDDVMRGALAKLFKEEKCPFTLIKWKELYERLERTTDRCESIASIIQSIVLEAS